MKLQNLPAENSCATRATAVQIMFMFAHEYGYELCAKFHASVLPRAITLQNAPKIFHKMRPLQNTLNG
jgi:hypothetical protein